MTSRITVRRDQAGIRIARSAISGWRTMLSEQVQRLACGASPASVISEKSSDCESAPPP